MAATFYWPPFPEADVDHYNAYRGTVSGDPPVTTWSKIGETAQGAGPLLSFTDNTGTSTTLYRIASAKADQTEFVTSPEFTVGSLVGKARLFGRFIDTAGQAVPATRVAVALSLVHVVHHGSIITPAAGTYSQEDGYWAIDLVPNADLIPNTTKYRVSLASYLGAPQIDIIIPVGATLVYFPSLLSL